MNETKPNKTNKNNKTKTTMNETIQTQPPPELLDLDMGSFDTSFAVIKPGLYELVVKEVTVDRTADDTGDMLVAKLATTRDATDVKGVTVKQGHTIFHRVGLRPTDKYDHMAIAKNVARFTQALKPSVSFKAAELFNGGLKTLCKTFEGCMIQAKVEALPEGVDKKSGRSLPPRNEISQLVKSS